MIVVNGHPLDEIMAHYHALRVLIQGLKEIRDTCPQARNHAIEVLKLWETERANKIFVKQINVEVSNKP